MVSLRIACVVLGAITTLSSASNPLSTYEVVFSWKQLDYNFPSHKTRERLIETKEFIPENNVVVGVKPYGSRAFLSVPRWRKGVPSTLNYVELNDIKSPKLNPFPSWEMQEIGNCSALQYVQSMEIDEFGRMWIIDVGRENIFAEDGKEIGNYCPAKLVIVDLKTDEIVKKYEFPNEVVSRTNNFLNDLVVGCSDRNKCWAYISDARDAKLIAYNLEEDRSLFVHHKTMAPDMSATNIPILGMNYTFRAGIDGISLSPKDTKYSHVYYTPLASTGLFSIPTSILQDSVNGVILKDSDVTTLTTSRSSQMDGMVIDSQGLLFYGGLQNNSVFYMNTTADGGFDKEILLIRNDVDLQWADSFGFDDKGYLYTVTNRIHRFQTNTMDWSEVNFRVARVFIGSRGYMFSAKDKVSDNISPYQLDSTEKTPTNLDKDAPNQPIGVGDTDVYKHGVDHQDTGENREHDDDHQGNQMGSGRSYDNHYNHHSVEGQASSAPIANEQLPIVLFLSVLMYNPALLVEQ